MKQAPNINTILLTILMFLVGFMAIEAHRMIEDFEKLAREVATIHSRQQMNEHRIDRLERARP